MNTNARFGFVCGVLASLCLLAMGLFSGTPAPARAQDATVQPYLTAPLNPPVPDTSSCWGVAADPISVPHFLYGVNYPSADRAWAVGADISGKDGWVPMVLRWDGTTWTRAPLVWNGQGAVLYGVWDQPGTRRARVGDDTMRSVGKPSPAWAVGETFNSGRTSFGGPLLFRLVGEEWQQYDLGSLGLSQPGLVGSLYSISGSSPDDLWAVGEIRANPSANSSVWSVPLALHWNGSEWQRVPIPLGGQGAGEPVAGGLKSIAAVSPSDVWAVGYWEEINASHKRPLVLHWIGGVWVREAIAGAEWGALLSVMALSPTQAWAVGQGNGDGPTALRWDGKSWQAMQTYSATNGQFASVVALTPTDLWAVGSYGRTRTEWGSLVGYSFGNDTEWKETDLSGASTSGGYGDQLEGIAASPDGDLWTVGQVTWGGPGRPSPDGLLWHHRAGCSFSTPTPTRAAPLNPPMPLPGSGSHTFPETGKTLNGLFLDYWNAHGGLMQQGYPISDLMGEVSDLNGKLYTMQYTERAVFEYHPEYQAPYDVLLSQLGTFEYRKRYPQGAPNQQPNTDPGSVVFKETGHRLGGRFLDYWQTHGGLMQQGYPISDEFTEVSALNGQTYRVQYFERAVFEYHPENQPPYDVLLSQLGKFRYDAKYNTNGVNITALPGADLVAGHYTFWQTGRAETSTINGYDLQQKHQFVVSQSPTNKNYVASDGKRVVWVQDCPPYCQRLRGYDLQTGQEFSILEPSGRQFWKLYLDGDTLYFEEQDKERTGLYSRNLITGEEHEIARGGFKADERFQPVIENGYLLYSQVNDANSQWTLHALKLDGSIGDRSVATSAYGFTAYHAEGNYIIWSPYPEKPGQNPPTNVYLVDVGVSRQISNGPGYRPSMRAGIVVWTELVYDQASAAGFPHGPIVAYDLHTGKQWRVVPDRSSYVEVLGITDDNQVVFREQLPLQGTLEVYAVPLSGGTAATPTPSPTVTPAARLIARDIRGKAASNDRYLFWIDANNAVYGYDSQQNTQFPVSNRPGFKESLTCDDSVVAWLEGDVEGTASIRGYDLIDHRELTLVPETGPGKFGEGRLDLDGSMLYYGGSIGGHYGIIARNWDTGQENLLIDQGYNPVQWGDVLLWGKEIAHCDPNGGHPPCWFEQALAMRKANHDSQLTTAYGQSHFEQYAVDGNKVVWVAPDLAGSGSPLHLYDVNSGADSVLSPQMANNPQIRGDLIAWAEQPQSQPGAGGPWSLLLYNLADKTTKTLLAGSPGLVQAQGIMGQKAVTYTVGGQNYPAGPHGDLYLLDLGR